MYTFPVQENKLATDMEMSPAFRSFWETLLPHQKQAIQWLEHNRRYNIHSILGDGMGMGKTLQVMRTGLAITPVYLLILTLIL